MHLHWWDTLTGMWLLDAHYDEGDRSCDHLFQPNAARLAWWTARRDAVAAAFVS